MSIKHICKTCRFAVWERQKNGRVNPRRAGQCTWPVPDFLDFPFVVDAGASKSSIWHDFDTECAAWEIADG